MNIKKFRDKKNLFVYTERYVNKGAYHSFRHYSEVSRKFRPRDGDKNFKLPFIEIDNPKIDFLKTIPDKLLLDFIRGKKKTKFFFHPDMSKFYQDLGCQDLLLKMADNFIKVIPASSTRTLLFNLINKSGNEKIFMLKVDLSGKRLGRLVRDLRGNSAKQSNRVSEELDYLSKKIFYQKAWLIYQRQLLPFLLIRKSKSQIYLENMNQNHWIKDIHL